MSELRANMNRPNALNSLRSLAGNVGARVREQEVHTPEWLLDVVRAALGGIHVDPCAASTPEHWFASKLNITLPPVALALEHRLMRAKHAGDDELVRAVKKKLLPYYLDGGVTSSWGRRTHTAFGNVPFGFLEPWIRRFQLEGAAGRRCIGLWPVRTHRPWWALLHRGAEIVFLDYKIAFVGHTHAFPAPLCLAAWNCTVPDLGERETFRLRLR